MSVRLALAVFALAAAPSAPALAADPAEFGPAVLHVPHEARRAEQGILRPVPIAVTLPPEVERAAHRTLVHYQLWGESEWTALALRRDGVGWRGAIPCLEVSTVTGDLRYYLRVYDEQGRVIATGASRASPYVVAIKHDSMLPGAQRVVARCPDPSDCPSGLLGCPSERVIEIKCQSDADCEGGDVCGFRGICEPRRRRNLVTVGLGQELGVVSALGACSLHAQEHEGFACFRDDGTGYIGSPAYVGPQLAAGRSMTRVSVGYERLVHEDTTLGVRVGWAFLGEAPAARGAPSFVPLSLAVRATRWWGGAPVGVLGLRPYAFLTAGFAQFDVSARTWVQELPGEYSYQGGNDLQQRLRLTRRGGDGFVGVGAGLGYAFAAGVTPTVELSVLEAFPFATLVVAGTAGAVVPF